MKGMHKTLWSRAFGPSTPCIPSYPSRVLTICHLKLTQNTALEQKRLELRSLLPALPYLWFLLVSCISQWFLPVNPFIFMWKHDLVPLVTSPVSALKNDFEAQLASLFWRARMIMGSQTDSSSFFSLLNSHKAAMRDKPLLSRRLC